MPRPLTVGIPRHFIFLLFFVLGVFSLGCSQSVTQSRHDPEELGSYPECLKNCTEETRLFSGSTYRTWARYEDLEFNTAFDSAVLSLERINHRVVLADRESGKIQGELLPEGKGQKRHSMDVLITRDHASLVVSMNLEAGGGNGSRVVLCRFYEEFERLTRQNAGASHPESSRPAMKPTPKPGSPSPKAAHNTASPAPAGTDTKPKSVVPPAQPPVPRPSPSIRTTEVLWSTVNFREGPGMNHKVLGSLKKGTALQILGDKGNWLNVRLEDKREVWIFKSATAESVKKNVPPAPPSPSSAASSTKRALPKSVSPM